jgi:hypothetical protein
MGPVSLTNRAVIDAHFVELKAIFSDLSLLHVPSEDFSSVAGRISFCSGEGQDYIEDTFEINITIGRSYPERAPKVKEVAGRIPPSFHRQADDGSLCLGSPLEVEIRFSAEKTLAAFATKLIIPYLYSFSYFEKHKTMPFGELPHGGEGLLADYTQKFSAASETEVCRILAALAKGCYRGHDPCCCGSGRRMRHCHGTTIQYFRQFRDPDQFKCDLLSIQYYLQKNSNDRSSKAPVIRVPGILKRIFTRFSRKG